MEIPKRKKSGRQHFEPTNNKTFFQKEDKRREARPKLDAATWKPSYITPLKSERMVIR